MPWLHTKTNDNLSTICVQFVFNLSTICPNFVLVLSEFCHNKNKTKQRQMTNCIQIVDNLSFVFVLSCFCIQFVICLYFVLFLLWQNSDKTRHGYRQRWLLYNATTLYNICRFKSCISKKPTNIAVTKNVVTNIAIQHMLVKCCAPTFSCRSYPCLSRRVKEKTLKVFSVMMKRYSVNLWK